MITVRAAPPEHYGWIATRAGLATGSSFRAIEAIDHDGRILGMVGYDGWTPNSCCMHVAIDEPIAVRRLIRPAFGMVFDPPPRGLGRGVALASVLTTNKRALDLDVHLGFRPLCLIRDGWAEGIGIQMLEMRREDCRWLRSE